MPRRFLAFALFALALSAALTAEPDASAPTSAEAVPADWTPYVIRVTDADTGKPVTSFGYRFVIGDTAGRKRTFERTFSDPWKNDAGELTIMAPESAFIRGCVTGGSLLQGYNEWHEWKAEPRVRRWDLKAATGVTLSGRVLDADSGKPLADASVAPIIFSAPLFVGDFDRSGKTDAEGRYRIEGVDPRLGAMVKLAGFEDVGSNHAEGPKPRSEFRMRRLLQMTGRVVSADGKALGNVKIRADSADIQPFGPTGTDGKFDLSVSSSLRECTLTFHKRGFLSARTTIKAGVKIIPPTVMQPSGVPVVVRGRVVDVSGRAVSRFDIIVSGDASPSAREAPIHIESPDGAFNLALKDSFPDDADISLVVTAPGMRIMSKLIPPKELGSDAEVILRPVRIVSGSVVSPYPAVKGKLRIVPKPLVESGVIYDEWRTMKGAREAEFSGDGKFTVEIAAEGPLFLIASQSGCSTVVTVWNESDSHPILRLSPSARLSGRYRSTRAGASPGFNEGLVFRYDLGESLAERIGVPPLRFVTDGNGMFDLPDVPVGKIAVSFPYDETADMRNTDTYPLQAAPGMTTKVEWFKPPEDK